MIMTHRNKNDIRNAIRGSMIGGAVGDALGYAVEFIGESAIFSRYGKNGITEYDLDRKTGKAIVSDDTQMTLFTANGLLVYETQTSICGLQNMPRDYVAKSYQDWYITQKEPFDYIKKKRDTDHANDNSVSWLLDIPELFHKRAPGITCLNALYMAGRVGGYGDYIKYPRNNSKGCGGVMRIAPIALNNKTDIEKLDMEAAQLAAITHGHSLGYMPASVMCHIINRIVFPYDERKSLKEIVIEAKETTEKLFSGDKNLTVLSNLIDLAVEFSENSASDLDNIHRLGEGWVAEEALVIAIYCALRYQDDFSRCMIASVNHKGDSDSTGAIAGNILGAWVGYDRIEEKWKTNLELRDTILEIADDLWSGCPIQEKGICQDPAWESKYIQMRSYHTKKNHQN